MHTKSIPIEKAVAGLGSNKALLVAGVAVLAAGAIYVSKAHSTSAASQQVTATDPFSTAGIGPASTSGSDALNSILGGGGVINGAGSSNAATTAAVQANNGGGVFSVAPSNSATPTPVFSGGGNPSSTSPFPAGTATLDPATAELLAQNRLSLVFNFAAEMTSLALQGHIVDTNAFLQDQAIQSMNFQAAANLASTFMLSDNQLSLGTIRGPDGNPLIDMALINARDTKGNSWNQDLIGLINRGTIDQFYTEIQHPANTQPLSPVGLGPVPYTGIDTSGTGFGTGSPVTHPSAPSPFDLGGFLNGLLNSIGAGNFSNSGSTSPAAVAVTPTSNMPSTFSSTVSTPVITAPQAVQTPLAHPTPIPDLSSSTFTPYVPTVIGNTGITITSAGPTGGGKFTELTAQSV